MVNYNRQIQIVNHIWWITYGELHTMEYTRLTTYGGLYNELYMDIADYIYVGLYHRLYKVDYIRWSIRS